MKVEYKKDLRHNYMVIEVGEEQKIEAYSIKMLEHQSIDGILPMEQRRMDNQILFYYDITAKQSMINLFDKTVLSFDKVKQLISHVIHIIEKAYEYLLSEDDFILSAEHVYLDINSNMPYLCFCCGYRMNIKEQMKTLIEYLMNKVDYNDKEAVLLIYQLYAISKEEGFTFDHLLEVLHKQAQSSFVNKNNKRGTLVNENFLEEDDQGTENISGESYRGNNAVRLKDKIYEKDTRHQKNRNVNGQGDIKQKDIRQKDIKFKDIKIKDTKLIDIKPVEIDHSKISKAELQHTFTTTDKQKQKNFEGSVMMEKLEGEEEIPCYPLKTYLYTGACVMGGVIVIVMGFATKTLYNTFGNRIEYSKLFAMFLILFCIEGYLIKIIWDKKNQITKLVMKNEYIDPRQEYRNSGRIFNSRSSNVKSSENSPIIDCGNSIYQVNKEHPVNQEQRRMEEVERRETKFLNSEEISEEEDYNPTCLLNESSEKLTLILKALEDTNYKNIIINDFPFFIGKLKKNVDYCLEKDVVSRFHAKITKEQEQYYITDMNSKNGTYVNKEILQTYQKKEIKLGDEIAFANIRYQFAQQN